MRNYIARYCLVTEDGGFEVAEIQAESFLDATITAINRTPALMKLYSIEEEALPKPFRRREWRDLKLYPKWKEGQAK